jgi:flagellar biosynthetic protein FliQ
MTPEEITDLIRYTLVIATEISAPILIVTLLLGMSISIFQSVTQITETTLIFIPKLVVFSITLAIFFPWMAKIMIRFTNEILINRWDAVISWTSYVM